MQSETLKVLVAEDEPAMLSLVARHMRALGFNVLEASEGDVALELAQTHVPDLVILDVMMPGMSGWEVCKRLKGPGADHVFSNTGVIMLTGIGENLNEMTSPLFAADAWLNKPFDFNDLDEKIRETLTRYAKPLPKPNGAGASLPPPPPEDADDLEPEPSTARPVVRRASSKASAPKKSGKSAAANAGAKKASAVIAGAKKAGAASKKSAKPAKKSAKPAKKSAPAAKKSGKKAANKPAAKKAAAKGIIKKAGGAKKKSGAAKKSKR